MIIKLVSLILFEIFFVARYLSLYLLRYICCYSLRKYNCLCQVKCFLSRYNRLSRRNLKIFLKAPDKLKYTRKRFKILKFLCGQGPQQGQPGTIITTHYRLTRHHIHIVALHLPCKYLSTI